MAIIFITKGKTNWKYLAIVFVLGAIAGAGTLWLVSKQGMLPTELPEIKKPEKVGEETADWKTYRNEEYGFEIKYPIVGWKFEERPSDILLKPLFAICNELYREEWKDIQCISGLILQMDPQCPIDWNKEIIENPPYRDCDLPLIAFVSKKIVTKEGEIGHVVEKDGMFLTPLEGWGPFVFAIFPNKARNFVLWFYYLQSPPSQLSTEMYKTLDQMLSTFRFLPPQ